MKPRQQVSRPAIELIKRFEGYRRSAAQLADGRWTVGYGHVKFAKEGVELPEKDAEALLIYDLIAVTSAVSDLVFTPLTQNQYDALVSFVFNIGIENFKGSAVLRRVNEGDLLKAAFAIETWRRADFEGESIVVDALVRRRAAEKSLFLTPQSGFVAAPSSVLQPVIDLQVSPFPPAEPPRRLISPLGGESVQPFEDIVAAQAEAASAPFPRTIAATVDSLTDRLRDLVPDIEPIAPSAVDRLVLDEPEGPPASAEPVLLPFPVEAVEITDDEPEAVPDLEPVQTVARQKPVPVVGANRPIRSNGNGARHFSRAPVAARKLAPLIGLSAAGIAAFAFAIFWRLNAGASEAQAASAQLISYGAGIVGIGCIFAAAYLILDGLSGEDR